MSDTSSGLRPSAPLSTTAIAAIATGIGISLICIIALIYLLVRAVRIHKQLLADLEERGVSIVQAQGEAQNSVTRPRTVLRRNTIHPYNKNSGWNTLTSVETLKSGEMPGAVEHYVPPKPTEASRRAGRLSWPFHARRMSGHSIHLKKMKGPRLSTVLEDPKPSALVPVLSSSHLQARRPSLIASQHYGSRPSSSQSLLQYHPAFRNSIPEYEPVNQESSAAGISFFRTEANDRLQRAKSIAAFPSAEVTRPQLRERSASLYTHASGRVPDVILPPLPLDIARIQSEADRRTQLRRIPSKQSFTSIGSTDTIILASHASPLLPQTAKRRPQKITKPRTRGSTIGGARPFRDSLDLRVKVLGLKRTADSSPTHLTPPAIETEDPYNYYDSGYMERPHSQSFDIVNKVQAAIMNRLSWPTDNSPTSGIPATPKRKLKSQTYSEGSPERQQDLTTISRGTNGVIVRSPKRQHSQTSSRSSGGNPFQWDPTPSATGKPSALKGSPSARQSQSQSHNRKSSVRISLKPTYHGPPGTREDTSSGATSTSPVNGLGIAFPSTRSLPTPPSSSTFAPELKFPTTSLRASLTSTSPTLPLVEYDQSYVVFPTDHVSNELSKLERNRLSNGSVISLSNFPETPSIIEPCDMGNSLPLISPPAQPYDFNCEFQVPETPYLHQYPFRPETPEQQLDQPQSSYNDLDNYDPKRTSMIFQTPTNNSSRAWQSAFAAIPEESSVSSQKTPDVEDLHHDDSPPVSPRSLSPPKFNLDKLSAYNIPVCATTIPEETPNTVDPVIPGKDIFTLPSNNTNNNVNRDIQGTASSRRSSLVITVPTNPDLAHEALLEADFPSSPPILKLFESPVLGHRRSEASSLYSLPSPLPSLSPTTSPIELPSPVMPCSPRPSDAQLPHQDLMINFAEIPKLVPSPLAPCGSPPPPLRSSIAALRRMNSDAANARKERAGRGERRYLRLGRDDSVSIPGDESWLDEMEDDDNGESTEEEGQRTVNDMQNEWEEGSTMHSTSTVTPDTELFAHSSEQEDTTAGAEEFSTNIWEDSEKFWTSQTPPRPDSVVKSSDGYRTLVTSPLASPISSNSSPPSIKMSKKRDYEVTKDSSPTQSPTENHTEDHDRKKRRESIDDDVRCSISDNRHRKRNVLGVSTPNVKIQVTSPTGHVMNGAPGSLYDSQGFLRY